jgi:hypothetical protein
MGPLMKTIEYETPLHDLPPITLGRNKVVRQPGGMTLMFGNGDEATFSTRLHNCQIARTDPRPPQTRNRDGHRLMQY